MRREDFIREIGLRELRTKLAARDAVHSLRVTGGPRPSGGRSEEQALSTLGEVRDREGQQGLVRELFGRYDEASKSAKDTVRRNFATRAYETGELLLKEASVVREVVAEYPWLQTR